MKIISKHKNTLRVVTLLVALGLTIVGQYFFAKNNKTSGLHFLIPGVVLAVIAARGTVPRGDRKPSPAQVGEEKTTSSQTFSQADQGFGFLSGKKNPIWAEFLAFCLILGLAWFLRAYKVVEIPPCLFDDESNTALDAVKVLNHEITNPLITGWYEVPTLYSYISSLSFHVFGVTVLAARATAVAYGVLTVAAMYFLCRYLFGVPLALAAMAMFAMSRFHITMSRWGASEVAPSFYMLMGYGFLVRGLGIREGMTPKAIKQKTGFLRWPGWCFIVSGIFLGLCLYTYLASRLVAMVPCLFFGYLLVLRFDLFRRNFWRILLLGIAFGAVFYPLAYHYYNNWLIFSHRWQDVNIFKFCDQSGNMKPFWISLERHVLMFNWKANEMIRHCMPGLPLLNSVTAVFFALGWAFSLRRWRHPFYFFMQLWFWLTLSGGILSYRGEWESPCPYPVLTVCPTIYIFAVIALLEYWDALAPFLTNQFLPWFRRIFWTALWSLTLIGGALDVYVYFWVQAKDNRMWAHYNPVEHIAALRTKEYSKDFIVYLHPHYYTFSTVKLLNYPYNNIFKFLGSEDIPFLLKDDYPVALITFYNDGWLESVFRRFYPNVVAVPYEDPVTPGIGFKQFFIPAEDIQASRGLTATYTVTLEDGQTLTESHQEKNLNFALTPDKLGAINAALDKPIQAVWEGMIRIPQAGKYSFLLRCPTPPGRLPVQADIYVAGKPFLENGQKNADSLLQGGYPIRVVARNLREGDQVQLCYNMEKQPVYLVPSNALFTFPGAFRNGLKATYYSSPDWTGTPVMERVDLLLTITERVNEGSYGVRWTGKIQAPVDGHYTFATKSDDDSFVNIDGNPIVNNSGGNGSSMKLGDIVLTEGWHDVEIKYCNQGGGATFDFMWTVPGRPQCTVPTERLKPE